VKRFLALAVAVACGVAASAQAAQFQSPSRNIGCAITRQAVRCDIREREWKPPPKPRSCRVDYGQGVYVARRGKARFVCAGDTALGVGPVLDYGRTIRRGRFRCKSRTDGMRCVNRRNGHGFFLSRARVKRF
jgi:hypothetical protein